MSISKLSTKSIVRMSKKLYFVSKYRNTILYFNNTLLMYLVLYMPKIFPNY